MVRQETQHHLTIFERSRMGPPDSASPCRMLIIHRGALGDFLLALPAIQGLQRLSPGSTLDFLARTEYVSLIRNHPYVGRVYSSDSADLAPFHHEALWRTAQPPPLFTDISVTFVFGRAQSRAVAARLSLRLACPVHFVESFPGPDAGTHVTRHIREQLIALGRSVDDRPARIDPAPDESPPPAPWELKGGPAAGRRPVIIHMGSGGRRKIWPLSRWKDLVEWINAKYAHPKVLVLGPAEEYLREFVFSLVKPGIHVLENPPLARLSVVLSRCAVYVGNDSGISHLAAVSGAPSVVVFGPTDPHVWGPVGENVHIVRDHWDETRNLEWSCDGGAVALNEVKQAVGKLIEKG